MVGADLSGIELRMLAHYLARYDKGRYAKILTTGDIHQTNADRIGITRRQVKTVTYAFLYGAGNIKLGRSFDKLLPEEAAAHHTLSSGRSCDESNLVNSGNTAFSRVSKWDDSLYQKVWLVEILSTNSLIAMGST